MSFVSVPFWALFALALLSQRLLKAPRARQAALLVASYAFYAWWDWRFTGLLLFVTAAAYLTGLGLARRPGNRALLALGVAAPLAVLFFFKYQGLLSFLPWMRGDVALKIILPVGISFYTFQSISYTVDVGRGKVGVCRDPLKFALYIAFFPQLVAGPIVKARDFLPQLDEPRRPDGERLYHGLTQFFLGMFKKAVLADHLAVYVDAVYAAPGAYSSAAVWLAVLAYALQIYLDFSGYSDMALGAARCLGYDLPVNFDMPYTARSVGEFWQRWHISLSTWLKEYLYIPLGGNRRGLRRTLVNLMLTMALGGLWHGASLTFVAWGAIHGLALCAHRLWSRRFAPLPGLLRRTGAALLTSLFVALTWVLFRAETFAQAGAVYRRAFGAFSGVGQRPVWLLASALFLLARLVVLGRVGAEREARLLPRGTFAGTLGFVLLTGLTLILMYTGASPFIYFQF